MNKKIIIILIIILILSIVCGVGGYLVYIKSNNTETEWGDYYYQTLARESKKYETQVPDENGELKTKEFDEYVDTSNANVQFIQLEEDTIPIMAVSCEKDNHKLVKVYSAYESNNANGKYAVNIVQYPSYNEESVKDNDSDIQLLYNLEENRYIWYVHQIDKNKGEVFNPIILDLQDTIKVDSTEKHYYFKEEMKTDQVSEDGTPILSKFEETFIVVDNINNVIEIGDIHNIDEKVLKEHIKSAEKQYKDNNSIITEEIKTETETKAKELENKKEQIKVAEEEKSKKEAEEKAKAEEEAKKGLQVGSSTVKYGTYKDTEFGRTLILEENRKCVLDGEECTYRIGSHNFSQDVQEEYYTAIIIKWNGTELGLRPMNNQLIGSGPGEAFAYVGL